MKTSTVILCIILCIFLASCGENKSVRVIGGADGPTSIIISEKEGTSMYKQITPEEAKRIMDSGEEYILLDTREQEEYDQEHIPGAILIPYTEINDKAEKMHPDKEAQILVYCRSGRRSKIASESLSELGYTNVKEFGGIIDWPYEKESD